MVIEEHVVNEIIESAKQRPEEESRNHRNGFSATAFDPLILQPRIGG